MCCTRSLSPRWFPELTNQEHSLRVNYKLANQADTFLFFASKITTLIVGGESPENVRLMEEREKSPRVPKIIVVEREQSGLAFFDANKYTLFWSG